MRVFPEMLVVAQVVKKFSPFAETEGLLYFTLQGLKILSPARPDWH
jgi:hypothetical protein